MRLISLSPPILIASFALLGGDLLYFVQNGVWHAFSSADALALLGFNIPASGFWLGLSPGWPLLALGLAVGEAGLVQNRILAAKEKRMFERLRRENEECRARERHADMLVKRQRRLSRILNRAA
jgi:hypothetical protein